MGIRISLDDQGNVGGSAKADVDTIDIEVVHPAPTIDYPASATLTQGEAITPISAGAISASAARAPAPCDAR